MAVYKILRTFLEFQIDELDRAFTNDIDLSEREFYFKFLNKNKKILLIY